MWSSHCSCGNFHHGHVKKLGASKLGLGKLTFSFSLFLFENFHACMQWNVIMSTPVFLLQLPAYICKRISSKPQIFLDSPLTPLGGAYRHIRVGASTGPQGGESWMVNLPRLRYTQLVMSGYVCEGTSKRTEEGRRPEDLSSYAQHPPSALGGVRGGKV